VTADKPALVTGYVDFSAIADSSPQAPLLAAVDRMIALGARSDSLGAVGPENLNVDAYLQQVSSAPNEPLRTDFGQSQQTRLLAVRKNILDELNERLSLSEDLQIAELRKELVANGLVELNAESAIFQEQAEAETNKFTTDASRITSLKMQIAAMKVNENPPPTAPRDHWEDLQVKKEAELSDLLSAYDANLQIIYNKRDQLVAADAQSINNTIQATLLESRTLAEQQKSESLASAQQRFDKEQQELNEDDAQVFKSAELSFGVSAGNFAPLQSPMAAFGVAKGNASNSTAYLLGFRAKLKEEIYYNTQHLLVEISKQMHVKLVKRTVGVKNLTGLFIDAAKNQDWKVS